MLVQQCNKKIVASTSTKILFFPLDCPCTFKYKARHLPTARLCILSTVVWMRFAKKIAKQLNHRHCPPLRLKKDSKHPISSVLNDRNIIAGRKRGRKNAIPADPFAVARASQSASQTARSSFMCTPRLQSNEMLCARNDAFPRFAGERKRSGGCGKIARLMHTIENAGANADHNRRAMRRPWIVNEVDNDGCAGWSGIVRAPSGKEASTDVEDAFDAATDSLPFLVDAPRMEDNRRAPGDEGVHARRARHTLRHASPSPPAP